MGQLARSRTAAKSSRSRRWLEFKERYNRAWLCERHGHQTPAQVRARLLDCVA